MSVVDLLPGPAFVWWQLVLGAAIVLGGVAGLMVTRLRRSRRPRGVLVLLAAVVIGGAAVVRSFRTP